MLFVFMIHARVISCCKLLVMVNDDQHQVNSIFPQACVWMISTLWWWLIKTIIEFNSLIDYCGFLCPIKYDWLQLSPELAQSEKGQKKRLQATQQSNDNQWSRYKMTTKGHKRCEVSMNNQNNTTNNQNKQKKKAPNEDWTRDLYLIIQTHQMILSLLRQCNSRYATGALFFWRVISC